MPRKSKEEEAAYQRDYRAKNKDALATYRRAWKAKWRANNPDKARAERRALYERHREREMEGHRRWRETPNGRQKRRASNYASRDRNEETRLLHDAKRLVALSVGLPRSAIPRAMAKAKAAQLAVRRLVESRDGALPNRREMAA